MPTTNSNLLDQWIDALDHDKKTDDRLLVEISETIEGNIDFRDAIMLSTTTSLSRSQLHDVAFKGGEAATIKLASTSLQDSLHDTDAAPKSERVDRALRLLIRFGAGAQTLAAGAYLNWVIGRTQKAAILALKALNKDPETTLATIVFTAIEHDITPESLAEE